MLAGVGAYDEPLGGEDAGVCIGANNVSLDGEDTGVGGGANKVPLGGEYAGGNDVPLGGEDAGVGGGGLRPLLGPLADLLPRCHRPPSSQSVSQPQRIILYSQSPNLLCCCTLEKYPFFSSTTKLSLSVYIGKLSLTPISALV